MTSTIRCVACGEAMTTRCACGGAWLAEAKLVEMAQEIKGSLIALAWRPRPGADQRPCPVCATSMLAVSLVKVELDRCVEHGVWFDADELEKVLSRARKLPDAPDGTLDHPAKAKDTEGAWALVGAIVELLGVIGELAG